MGTSATGRRALREAHAWEQTLRQPSVCTHDIHAFRTWLDEVNASVWDRLAAERYRHDRFVVRRDANGFSVIDVDAAPAVDLEGGAAQALEGLEAQALASQLNRDELDRRLSAARSSQSN